MGDKRANERRIGIVKHGPTQCAMNNQAWIDEKKKVFKRQCLCKQQQRAFKRVERNHRKRLEASGIHMSNH
jgi:hypothetical protein